MEIKKLEQYSDDELKELLFFWFRYYVKKAYSLDELDKFNKMINEQPKTMFRAAVILYQDSLGPTVVLDGIRGNLEQMEKCLNKVKKVSKSEMEKAASEFIKEVVTSYNNPEPNVPQKESDIIGQILEMLGVKTDAVSVINLQSENSISIQRIMEIMDDVAFKKEEIIDGMPNKNFVSSKILGRTFAYPAERLDKYKKEISSMVDKLPPFTRPRSFNELAITRTNETWALTQEHVEALLSLAVACGILSITEEKNGIPYFVRNKNVPKKINGQDPDEFPCFKGFFQRKKNKKLDFNGLMECTKESISSEATKFLELLGYKLVINDSESSFYQISDGSIHPAEIKLDYREMSFKTESNGKILEYSLVADKQAENGEILITEYITSDALGNGVAPDGEYFKVCLGNDELNPGKVYSINIVYINTNLDQKLYRFAASKDQIHAAIESDIPTQETEFGTKRFIYYTDPVSDKVCPSSLYLNEEYGGVENYIISVDRTGENSFDHSLKSASTRDKTKRGSSKESVKSSTDAQELAINYLKTSRVKNLYNRVSEVLDGALPGIKELINENHAFTAYMEEIMKCKPDKIFEELMNKCAIKEANVPGEERRGPRRKRDVK